MNESSPLTEVEVAPDITPPAIATPELNQTVSKSYFGKFLKISFWLLAGLLLIDLILLGAGFASSDYATVSSFSNISGILMYPIAILSGVCLSVYTARLNTYIYKMEQSNSAPIRKNTHLAIILPTSILISVIIGYATSDYRLGLAVILGLPIFGYIMWRRHGKSYVGWQKVLLYGFAAIIGLLPGAIAALLISLVLSDRACTLSSSKCY